MSVLKIIFAHENYEAFAMNEQKTPNFIGMIC